MSVILLPGGKGHCPRASWESSIAMPKSQPLERDRFAPVTSPLRSLWLVTLVVTLTIVGGMGIAQGLPGSPGPRQTTPGHRPSRPPSTRTLPSRHRSVMLSPYFWRTRIPGMCSRRARSSGISSLSTDTLAITTRSATLPLPTTSGSLRASRTSAVRTATMCTPLRTSPTLCRTRASPGPPTRRAYRRLATPVTRAISSCDMFRSFSIRTSFPIPPGAIPTLRASTVGTAP